MHTKKTSEPKRSTSSIALSKLSQAIAWLDDNILIVISGFLLAFIPLYPKLPLFEAIPGYIVRVRLEDILLGFSLCIWLIQVLRKKIAWKTPLNYSIGLYAIAGLCSVVSGVFITQTIPPELLHVGKSLLHYFRYLEYFSVLFIIYSAVTTKKHLQLLFGVLVVTILSIIVYGFGQRHYYWPVYSTMNREFSKGIRLYLTEHARVQSTFGGHYDLAGFLVLTLPLVLAGAYVSKNKAVSAALHIVHVLGMWLLVVSASRSSFLGYLLALTFVIFLIALKQKNTVQKLLWFLSRFLTMSLVTLIMMSYFGSDISERFINLIDKNPQASVAFHTVNKYRKDAFDFVAITLNLKDRPKPQPPANSISVDDAIAQGILNKTDERPTSNLPSDVYVDVPDLVEVATVSADGTVGVALVERERVWSEAAKKFDLSLAIRIDSLWPRAWAGFLRNPIFGSGYATLTKETIYQFTEAESTDNNFLRTLGETGLFGFITFYGAVFIVLNRAKRLYQQDDTLWLTLGVGFMAGSTGLLLNALLIDVFAASKVAFTFWIFAALVLSAFSMYERQEKRKGVFAQSQQRRRRFTLSRNKT